MVGTRLSQRSQRKESSDSSEDSFVDPEPQLCNICTKTLDDDDEEGEMIKSLECEHCGKWSHNACANVTPDIFELINQHNFRWFCPTCEGKSLNLSNLFVYYQHLQLQHRELMNEVAVLKTRLDTKDDARSTNSEQNSHFPSLLGANTPKDTTQITKFVDDHVKPAISSAVSKSSEVSALLSDMIEEKEQINKIKLNLVVSGVEESTSNEEDVTKITNILTNELKISPQIEKVERCGKLRPNEDGSPSKPRLLKLFMKNARNRKELLQKAKELRNSRDEYTKNNIYLRPDQTLKQQKDSKNLRDKLRQLRSDNPGKVYFIKKGVIEEREQNLD